MGSDEHVCPVCGQPVTTVVRRYKTLGAWVPKWVAGPCRNPECEAYADSAAEAEGGLRTSGKPVKPVKSVQPVKPAQDKPAAEKS